MNKIKYTTDRSTQILIALLKAHGIRKVVASPGTTNAIFVASIQNDSDFEVYSSADERSAAYIACGLAQESGEPVVITCTEATASRNYLPALTEAYYRKLPILAITGYHCLENVGHLYPQAIDRSVFPKDTVKLSVNIETFTDDDKKDWNTNFLINKAILELRRKGGGPVHINMQIARWDFYAEEIPKTRVIKRIGYTDPFPALPNGKIAITIGAHQRFSKHLISVIDSFCESHNAAVFANHVSGYSGKYKVNDALVGAQRNYNSPIKEANLIIHLGEIGASRVKGNEVWRVSSDGEIRDSYKKLKYVFEMDESFFFEHYKNEATEANDYFKACEEECQLIEKMIPQLPFSNVWIAQQTHHKIPSDSVIHFGILNSYRAWSFFKLPHGVESNCNVGGFGIDGGLSTLIGASFASPNKKFYGIFGDLAFFYDMNSLGNRHIKENVRIMLINNGKGNEFRNCIHPAYKLGEMADSYIAAAGHYGNKSSLLVRHYAEDLGFKYYSASSKDEYTKVLPYFLETNLTNGPVIFEVFTNGEDESSALKIITTLKGDSSQTTKNALKDIAHNILGDKTIHTIKGLIK